MINCIVFSDFTNGQGKARNGEQISHDVLAAHAAAIQEQLCGPFADAWDGAQVRCRVGAPNGTDCGADERLMCYFQTPDQPGAAGYHATDPNGRPYGKVFLDDAETMSGGPRAASVIASHEGCEMTLDPTANLFAARMDGTLDAYEASDAVEDTTYTATNGIEVSNFLYPAAFDPGASGPYDKLGALQNQYDTTSGGYRITGTVQINAATGKAEVVYKAAGPGLADQETLSRKMRKHGRSYKRGVVFTQP